MPHRHDTLFNFLLTQKAVNGQTFYDILQKVIEDNIQYLQDKMFNARIANLAFNINNQLTLAQIFIERKNGFINSKDNRFGTTPTAYRIQFRFPFGLETILDGERILIPPGQFDNHLKPYTLNKVFDDVKYDYDPKHIQCGPGVELALTTTGYGTDLITFVTLKCSNGDDEIHFLYENELGKGYNIVSNGFDYPEAEDYQVRLKKAGVYPLFYTENGLTLKFHEEYQGYTKYQVDQLQTSPNRVFEPERNKDRNLGAYREFINTMHNEIFNSPTGQKWLRRSQECNVSDDVSGYIFDLTVINGNILLTQTGFPLLRLRDYQLELFKRSLHFLQDTDHSSEKRSTIVAMGVGAGKTFVTATLLQHIRYEMDRGQRLLAPPFCLAPDQGVAHVTETTISHQGVSTGITGFAITSAAQMPREDFLEIYNRLASIAKEDAAALNTYINQDLQQEILDFCITNGLHPNQMINFLFNIFTALRLNARFKVYKESIDIKRIILLVDGQIEIKKRTGCSDFVVLKNLLEQFTLINNTIIESKMTEEEMRLPLESSDPTVRTKACRKKDHLYLFNDACPGGMPDVSGAYLDSNGKPKIQSRDPITVRINYRGIHSYRMAGSTGNIDFSELTDNQLLSILRFREGDHQKWIQKQINVRHALMNIVALNDLTSAILIANSGGLGSTSSLEQLEADIQRLLPLAVQHLKNLTSKLNLTLLEHYRLYLSFSQIFTTIPDSLHIKKNIRNVSDFGEIERHYFYPLVLNLHLELIDKIFHSLDQRMTNLRKVSDLNLDPVFLNRFNLHGNETVIEAANKLAGVASLQITGRAEGVDAKLLLTHIPVFTPEGLASYFEHLASLVGKPQLQFEETNDVYTTKNTGIVSEEDIKQRLLQILQAIVIADEIHKEEFEFLCEVNNPIYQRINAITRRFLSQEFLDVLPHRIGMSGTMNNVARRAFGNKILYRLSTQKMMQDGLMKQVAAESYPFSCVAKEEYAKQIVIDYFIQSNSLSLQNVLNNQNVEIDLSEISKGILFSKVADEALNELIGRFFNVLFVRRPAEAQRQLQVELLTRINHGRRERAALLMQKLRGEISLSSMEVQQIELYNRLNETQIQMIDGKIQGYTNREIVTNALTSEKLHTIQIKGFQNQLFALYLQYVLSKSSSPKELSDIVGLQNILYEQGISLIDIGNHPKNPMIHAIIQLIEKIEPSCMTEADVRQFLNERIHDSHPFREQLIGFFAQHKNNHIQIASSITAISNHYSFTAFCTTNRAEFEAGTAMVMLGTPSEHTGYSHEPISTVIDISMPKDYQEINRLTRMPQWNAAHISSFLRCLRNLANDTFSYDDKNQAGGRALRTPYGHVRYMEYQTEINQFIQGKPSAFNVFKLETQFTDIFTFDEEHARRERASVNFNRTAFALLSNKSYEDYVFEIKQHFHDELQDERLQAQYEAYINERLHLLWLMQNAPAQAAVMYFEAPATELAAAAVIEVVEVGAAEAEAAEAAAAEAEAEAEAAAEAEAEAAAVIPVLPELTQTVASTQVALPTMEGISRNRQDELGKILDFFDLLNFPFKNIHCENIMTELTEEEVCFILRKAKEKENQRTSPSASATSLPEKILFYCPNAVDILISKPELSLTLQVENMLRDFCQNINDIEQQSIDCLRDFLCRIYMEKQINEPLHIILNKLRAENLSIDLLESLLITELERDSLLRGEAIRYRQSNINKSKFIYIDIDTFYENLSDNTILKFLALCQAGFRIALISEELSATEAKSVFIQRTSLLMYGSPLSSFVDAILVCHESDLVVPSQYDLNAQAIVFSYPQSNLKNSRIETVAKELHLEKSEVIILTRDLVLAESCAINLTPIYIDDVDPVPDEDAIVCEVDATKLASRIAIEGNTESPPVLIDTGRLDDVLISLQAFAPIFSENIHLRKADQLALPPLPEATVATSTSSSTIASTSSDAASPGNQPSIDIIQDIISWIMSDEQNEDFPIQQKLKQATLNDLLSLACNLHVMAVVNPQAYSDQLKTAVEERKKIFLLALNQYIINLFEENKFKTDYNDKLGIIHYLVDRYALNLSDYPEMYSMLFQLVRSAFSAAYYSENGLDFLMHLLNKACEADPSFNAAGKILAHFGQPLIIFDLMLTNADIYPLVRENNIAIAKEALSHAMKALVKQVEQAEEKRHALYVITEFSKKYPDILRSVVLDKMKDADFAAALRVVLNDLSQETDIHASVLPEALSFRVKVSGFIQDFPNESRFLAFEETEIVLPLTATGEDLNQKLSQLIQVKNQDKNFKMENIEKVEWSLPGNKTLPSIPIGKEVEIYSLMQQFEVRDTRLGFAGIGYQKKTPLAAIMQLFRPAGASTGGVTQTVASSSSSSSVSAPK